MTVRYTLYEHDLRISLSLQRVSEKILIPSFMPFPSCWRLGDVDVAFVSLFFLLFFLNSPHVTRKRSKTQGFVFELICVIKHTCGVIIDDSIWSCGGQRYDLNYYFFNKNYVIVEVNILGATWSCVYFIKNIILIWQF